MHLKPAPVDVVLLRSCLICRSTVTGLMMHLRFCVSWLLASFFGVIHLVLAKNNNISAVWQKEVIAK